MFTTLIVQPLFNLLVLIYAIIPGHNFGLAVILFTVIIRLLHWPLLKKQMHQVKQMRRIQPELKRIKKASGGDKRKEQTMMMELYKERGINPFGQLGIIILQLPILFGLYSGLQRVLRDHSAIVTFAYPSLQHMSWMKELAANIHKFDSTLFGIVDLTRPALGKSGLYVPALILVVGSAIVQYYQSKQLAPDSGESRTLKDILHDAKEGRQADQAEMNAVMSRNMRFLLPVMILLVTIRIASALSLYWLVSGLVAYIQQAIILREDTVEMEEEADAKPTAKERAQLAQEAEVVAVQPKPKKHTERKKRRKK